MNAALLQPRHRKILDNAVLMQLQTLLRHPEQETIWDSFHLLDCVRFHAVNVSSSTSQAIHAVCSNLFRSPPFLKLILECLGNMETHPILARGKKAQRSHTVVPTRSASVSHHQLSLFQPRKITPSHPLRAHIPRRRSLRARPRRHPTRRDPQRRRYAVSPLPPRCPYVEPASRAGLSRVLRHAERRERPGARRAVRVHPRGAARRRPALYRGRADGRGGDVAGRGGRGGECAGAAALRDSAAANGRRRVGAGRRGVSRHQQQQH